MQNSKDSLKACFENVNLLTCVFMSPPNGVQNKYIIFSTNLNGYFEEVIAFFSYEESGLTPKSGDRKSQYSAIRQTETQKLREAKLKKPEDKEMFKLTR